MAHLSFLLLQQDIWAIATKRNYRRYRENAGRSFCFLDDSNTRLVKEKTRAPLSIWKVSCLTRIFDGPIFLENRLMLLFYFIALNYMSHSTSCFRWFVWSIHWSNCHNSMNSHKNGSRCTYETSFHVLKNSIVSSRSSCNESGTSTISFRTVH